MELLDLEAKHVQKKQKASKKYNAALAEHHEKLRALGLAEEALGKSRLKTHDAELEMRFSRQEGAAIKSVRLYLARLKSYALFWAKIDRFLTCGEQHVACKQDAAEPYCICFLHPDEKTPCGSSCRSGWSLVADCPGCPAPANPLNNTLLTRIAASGHVCCDQQIVRLGGAQETWAVNMDVDMHKNCFLRVTFPCTDCHQRLEVFQCVYWECINWALR